MVVSLDQIVDIMALKKSVVKIGRLSTIYMIGSIAPKVLGLLLLPVFTHYLVPEQFGIVRLALQISQVLAILLQLGFGASLKSFYFKLEEQKKAYEEQKKKEEEEAKRRNLVVHKFTQFLLFRISEFEFLSK